MFFSNNGPNPRIERASMDGSDRVVIVHTGLMRVRFLSVDTARNILFWAEHNEIDVEVCNYDGSNRRVFTDLIITDGMHYYQVFIRLCYVMIRTCMHRIFIPVYSYILFSFLS